jgi:predicted metallo-beta-lactamase superfamily hydrolase
MCTVIETPDLNILVDPGVSLGPRWGFLPHPREYKALRKAREQIANLARKADVITISHYHHDHYSPAWKRTETVWTWSGQEVAREIFEGRRVLAKDIRSKINHSQRRRGWFFQDTVDRWVESLEVADGQTFQMGSTRLSFSQPVTHGEEGSALGYVLMLCVEYEDERVMHCSDVQGPGSSMALDTILDFNPNVAVIGGPPFYLSGFRVSEEVISSSLRYTEKAIEKIPCIIYDHHPLRSEDYFHRVSRLRLIARKIKHSLLTAAEYAGLDNNLLEARRRKLYEEYPPSVSFRRWASLPKEKRRRTMPPIDS